MHALIEVGDWLVSMPHLDNGALPLHVLNNHGIQDTLVRETHLGCESRVWHPLRGLAWCSLFQHAVDLLEGEALGFRHEEVGVQPASNTEGTPDEEDLGTQVSLVGTDHVWCDNGDDLYKPALAESDGDVSLQGYAG